MKNLMLVMVAVTICFSVAHSQEISFGAKAGINVASINGDGADNELDRVRFHVGGVVNIAISEMFAIQPELVYSAQGSRNETGAGDVLSNLTYINVPVLADVTLFDGFSLQGGPQVGILVQDEFEFPNGETESIDANSLDVAGVLGAQYKLPMGVFFQVRAAIGFVDLVDNIDAKNGVLSASVGWFFN